MLILQPWRFTSGSNIFDRDGLVEQSCESDCVSQNLATSFKNTAVQDDAYVGLIVAHQRESLCEINYHISRIAVYVWAVFACFSDSR